MYSVDVLSGCDVTSKLGTKQASLNAKPGVYVRQFGEDNQLTIDEMKNAEKYLIKLFRPKSLCTSFGQLRFEMYRTRKISLIDLPPSSHCLKGRIQRCHYVVRQGICLLQESPEMDPLVGQEPMDTFSQRSIYYHSQHIFLSDAAAINSVPVDVHV